MTNTKILVVGTGAIGGFYGSLLAKAGAKVATVCRSDYEIVKKSGIKINSPLGNFRFIPNQVLKEVAEYSENPDYILVATKVLPKIDIINIIKSKVSKNTSIILIQNGISIEEPLFKAFPENEIISGLAFICASKINPGEIFHQDYGMLTIGTYPRGISTKVTLLKELLSSAGIKCITSDNIILNRWIKLIWNAPFNPISVIAGGVDTKTILKNKESYELTKNIMHEVVLLANKSGFNISTDTIQANIDNTLKMTPYKTSMLLDFENSRPLEVDAILGNTVKIARSFGIKIPYIESLYALLTLIDQKRD